jgi:hypothetical protein
MTKLSPTLIAALRQRGASEIADLIELIAPIILKPEFTSIGFAKVQDLRFLHVVRHGNFFEWVKVQHRSEIFISTGAHGRGVQSQRTFSDKTGTPCAHPRPFSLLSLTHGASKCFSAGPAVATTECKKPFLLG